MKILFSIYLLLFHIFFLEVLFSGRAQARPLASSSTTFSHPSSPKKSFGLGVVFGEPTALTGKYWDTNSTAIDFGLSFWAHDYGEIFLDRLWHFPQARFPLLPYVGIGGDVRFENYGSHWSNEGQLALRVPLGLLWSPRSFNVLEIFGEIVPSMQILPGIAGDLGAGVGARFYF